MPACPLASDRGGLHPAVAVLWRHTLTPPPPPLPVPPAVCADRLVREIAAHKHHLQDAAQYALGTLMAQVLGDAALTPVQREQLVRRLLEELQRAAAPGQCQGECCWRA